MDFLYELLSNEMFEIISVFYFLSGMMSILVIEGVADLFLDIYKRFKNKKERK